MLVSDAIDLLRELYEKHGDLPFYLEDDEYEQYEIFGAYYENPSKDSITGTIRPARIVVGH